MKKNEKLEQKLKQANEKVVELLKTKIQLGSPKSTAKKQFNFDFVDKKEFYEKSKEFLSPTHERKKTVSKEKQFYEKSLKLKNRKLTKDLRCLNHDASK